MKLFGSLLSYYVGNTLFCTLYIVIKLVTPLCQVALKPHASAPKNPGPLDNVCGTLSMEEYQIFMFLGVVICVKTRKAASWQDFASTCFLFTKVANAGLFYFQNGYACVFYMVATLAMFFLFPEPVYKGPENITYFTSQTMEEALENAKNKKTSWLIEFYANSSQPCIKMSPHFSEVSHSYSLKNLNFGKIDVYRYPNVAEKYNISNGLLRSDLPTMIFFQNGEPLARRPAKTSKGTILNVLPSTKSIVSNFDLNNVYAQCKKALSK
ncbi:thioredoxin-related transmembrane protein 2-like [Convolutriloba macropyga]|uniref:thioredoxin-related transmembrane protein 2-like n=1 Tax=Convolutriloba macropyga TaxID=536237 RepID=UPI003F525A02